ncbi:MAG: hypothetical protein JNM76_12500 [Betaproteobacteria bacterium]|nr:hypothetical protein [Betaproteobacteria bacterium]
MHILAEHYRSEFLATPQLLRIDRANGPGGPVPTLLLKASTLLLKYIVQGCELELVLAPCNGGLLYGLRVADDPAKLATIWSIGEREVERQALLALVRAKQCPIFLFNELALNAAWTDVAIHIPDAASELLSIAEFRAADYDLIKDTAGSLIQGLSVQAKHVGCFRIAVRPIHDWKETVNHYITNRGVASPVHLFNSDEGGQQEQLALWLTDNLQFSGAVHSPQVPKGKGTRELTDLLLSHQFGTVLVESKALTIFNRSRLPSRDALASDVEKHIDKAVAQLRGAIRQLRQGALVCDRLGTPIEVERTHPMHAIILIPEFDLVQNPRKYDLAFVREFMSATKGFIHLLDVSELLRVVQSAEMIAERGERTTRLMAFDFYLMERAKFSAKRGTLCVEILFRRPDDVAK